MCTLHASGPRALVCDVAMPFVRSALADDPRLIVDYRSRPGDGTEVNLVAGDPATFDRCLRGAIDRANE